MFLSVTTSLVPWRPSCITDFLFTSVAVPLCLATDRLQFFVVNNHLMDGVSFNLDYV